MGKKNIKPQQQQPVIRYNTAKSIASTKITEENLTQGYTNLVGGTFPAWNYMQPMYGRLGIGSTSR